MKNKFLLLMLMCIVMFSCGNKVPNLSTDLFNYSDEIKAKAAELIEVSPLFDLEKAQVLVKTKDFNITNTYIFPFVYQDFMNYSVEDLKNEGIDKVEKHLYSIAKSRAFNEILFKEADIAGIKVTDEDVDAEINEIVEGDLEGFAKEIEKSPFKMDFMKQDVKKVITIEKYKNEIILPSIKVDVTDKEVEKYYNDNPAISAVATRAVARHIFKQTNGIAEDKKSAKMDEMKIIKTKLDDGEDFVTLVKKYSDDEDSKELGGLIAEYVEKGQAVESIDKAIFSLKDGEISDIITSDFGYHIFKVDSITPESKKSIEDVKPQIIKILSTEKQNKGIESFVSRIEKKYKVK